MDHGRVVGIVVVSLVVVAGVASVGGTVSAQRTGPTPIDSCRTITNSGRYVLTTDIENANQTVCIQILSSDVVFDGRNHTIESGPNTTESVGVKANNSLTGISNVTVQNVSTTGWTAGIYYRNTTSSALKNVNASANRRYGVLLRAASDIRLANVTASHNARRSLFAENTTNVTATTFRTRTSVVSFTASNVALTGIGVPPRGVPNRTAIGQRLGVAGTGRNATLRLGVSYTNRSVARKNVIENTLRMWTYNGTWTKQPGVNFVNVNRNHVVANVSNIQNASVFAPAGETPTPTPTPTATATPEPTDTPKANQTSTPQTSSSNGPGFGVAVAVVAVFAAALLVLRRR